MQISSVQSLSRVQLFGTPWIAAHQASLSITNSRSSLRLTSIGSVMPRYADNTSLIAESEEELKNLLMRVKEESERVSLKPNIKKTMIVASVPITSWKIEGEKMETVTVFLFLGSKITVDGDCSHEIRKCLLLGRKAMTNLESVLKSRDITMLTKVHIVRLWSSQWSRMVVRAGL